MAVKKRRKGSTGAAKAAPASPKKGGIKRRTNLPTDPVEPDIPEFPGELGQMVETVTKDGHYGNPFRKASSKRMDRGYSRSGILAMDLALGGGWKLSAGGLLYGEKSCLAGDTFINYHFVGSDGKAANTRGGTIAHLFNRFHDNSSGKEVYTALSMRDDGTVLYNNIEDVWETGEQECFLVRTAYGRTIKATENHRFFTGEDWVRLRLLSAGDTVYVHASIFDVRPDTIVSIESVGVMQTYDIQMRDPYNNFVANKFVVHNSGKSTAALMAVATLHKNDPEVFAVWVDVEGTIDKAWARKLGVDLDRLVVVEPETGEHAVDLADLAVRTREVGMVVTDSIAMIVPMKELDESSEKDTMALQARLIGKYIRRINNAFLTERARGHEPIIIHINQFRMKVGLVFGDPRTLPGGKSLEYATTQQVEIKNKEHTGKDDDKNEVVLYNEHNFKITKNKGGGPMKEGAFKLIRFKGHDGLPEAWVDQAKTIYKLGTQVDVVTGAANSFAVDGIDPKFRGAADFNSWALENPILYDEIQAKIIAGFRRKWEL